MLDIKFIEENRSIVEKAIIDKKAEAVNIDRLLMLAEDRARMRGEISELNALRNKAAAERNIEEGKNLKDRTGQMEEKLRDIEKAFIELMLKIPNVPSPDTPVGEDASANVVVREWGEKPQFNFTPKGHHELGTALDIIDTDTAGEVSGARFTYLKRDAALLQFALISHAYSVLTDEGTLKEIAEKAAIAIEPRPFIPVIPPYMMKSAVMNRMARLHPVEDRYFFEKDDLVLIGSAEHTLGPMHMDHTFSEAELPLRYVGYAPAFRREAGTYGKDMKGILRLHHFDKIEMETFVLPEDSYKEQDFIVAVQEYMMQSLGIPYRLVILSTGDMSAAVHRQYDVEAWFPGQNEYRETHTSDLIGGYQPRRLNTKVRRTDGKSEPVHMNDATVFAIGRTIAAIIENFQEEDGSVRVPEVLQKYLAKEKISKPV